MYCDEVCDCTGTHARTHTGAEVVEVVGEYIYIQNSMLLQSNKIIIYKLQRGVLCLVVVTLVRYLEKHYAVRMRKRRRDTTRCDFFKDPGSFRGLWYNRQTKTFENTK